METSQLDEIEIDLRHYIFLLKNWWWLFVLAALVAGSIAFLIQSRQPDSFSAETAIMVMRSPRGNNYDPYYDPYYDALADQRLALSYEELIMAEPVIARAVEMVGQDISPSAVSIQRGDESQIIRLTVRHEDAQMASDFANALVGAFVDFNESLLTGRYNDSAETLTIQIEQVEEQIAAIEAELSGLVTQSLDEQQGQLEALIRDARDTLITIQDDIDELETAGEERATNSRLAGLYIDKDIWQSSLASYVTMYQTLISRGEAQFGDTLQIQIEQLQTNRHSLQEIYANLVNSREAIHLAKLEAAPNIVQIEQAVPPLYADGRRPIELLAALLGVITSVGFVIALDLLNDSVRSPDQLERGLQLPVLGFIPESPDLLDNTTPPFVVKQPRNPISETFRKVRTKLEYAGVDGDLGVVVVTSSESGEGKSTLAVNLATVMAQSGKRTLLIDCDLRKPTIHQHFGQARNFGLTDYLRLKDTTLKDVIRETNQENLFLLTSGAQPPDPAELLQSQSFQKMIVALRDRTDMIVIDSPPMLVTDPMILSKQADGVLFAVRAGETKMRIVEGNIEELRRIGVRLVGTIISRANIQAARYGYSYYYNYYNRNYYGDNDHNNYGKKRATVWGNIFGRKNNQNSPAITTAD